MASSIREIFAEMRKCQVAISEACSQQPEGWRQDIVRWRRALADQLGRASDCLATMMRDEAAIIRDPFSKLRAALADHQASWPAVSLDPDVPEYRRSVVQVRAAFDRLEATLKQLERPGTNPATGEAN